MNMEETGGCPWRFSWNTDCGMLDRDPPFSPQVSILPDTPKDYTTDISRRPTESKPIIPVSNIFFPTAPFVRLYLIFESREYRMLYSEIERGYQW
jgi:hypothetical protein